MARWIHVHEQAVPFDYPWPGVTARTAFTAAGDHFVKDEIADFAVRKGYADEGKADASSRSTKAGPKRVRRRSRAKPRIEKESPAATTADTEPDAPVGDADIAATDRTADRPSVDSDAG